MIHGARRQHPSRLYWMKYCSEHHFFEHFRKRVAAGIGRVFLLFRYWECVRIKEMAHRAIAAEQDELFEGRADAALFQQPEKTFDRHVDHIVGRFLAGRTMDDVRNAGHGLAHGIAVGNISLKNFQSRSRFKQPVVTQCTNAHILHRCQAEECRSMKCFPTLPVAPVTRIFLGESSRCHPGAPGGEKISTSYFADGLELETIPLPSRILSIWLAFTCVNRSTFCVVGHFTSIRSTVCAFPKSEVQTQIALRHHAGSAMHLVHLRMCARYHAHASPNRGAIAFRSNQLDLDPILLVAAIVAKQRRQIVHVQNQSINIAVVVIVPERGPATGKMLADARTHLRETSLNFPPPRFLYTRRGFL